ncbi:MULTISPECIES: carbamoyltransferase HypF [Dehalococcoides]|uniref:Carbamoyltransferase n=1 Tax=Dehalococcoides mccartyi TaxID=61435 RepID=A0A328EKD2_9CHLR|nr:MULTISPECIES: carbamoyltransferase HypF [Dehalococcoides]AGG06889.1 [NiFe] hydrogenase maturation protein HypF [Dehalococcoides mccartyi DCMB5]RAL69072.1 [Ni/Fe] hydrogenase metallocenter assembly protein HypF [Dehalococcoides mccartyi]
MPAPKQTKRFAFALSGVVQGVGFRPFVYQLAAKHRLNGWVRNTSAGVEIEAEGAGQALDAFSEELTSLNPPQSVIKTFKQTEIPLTGEEGFEIKPSQSLAGRFQLVSPDIATCTECQKDIFAPRNRRYRYPFTNCTNCGPRFTIIEDIPYDRPLTTMKNFKMCPDCQAEYDNPLNRRFHAQPNACPICGPRLWLADKTGTELSNTDTIAEAAKLLQDGQILAVRGLGGFLLAADATNPQAVATLRNRKRRPSKPFAVMLANLEEARKYCSISKEEEHLLVSPAAPIVLCRWNKESPVCPETAPGQNYLGIMLSYTPLHHLLLKEINKPLVMTSGNLSEEPIAKDNDEALKRLCNIADYFLLHNRPIYSRYDDSVVMYEAGEKRVLRRARGYAPYPVQTHFKGKEVLAMGPQEKNTFCLLKDGYAFVSQHIGDMQNPETLDSFEETLAVYLKLFRSKPEIIAADLHPGYIATALAEEWSDRLDIPLVKVQHHHAHIASCLAEHGCDDEVIGVALDGTGYGLDGNIWGGEFFCGGIKQGFSRKAHLEYLPLPGGEAAIKKPYRTAVSYVYTLLGEEGLCFFKDIDPEELDIIKSQLNKKLNSPLTSSTGRLFDAVAALCGICRVANYDSQPAIELEAEAKDTEFAQFYPFELDLDKGIYLIRLKGILEGVLSNIKSGKTAAYISVKFHNTVSQIVLDTCRKLSSESGLTKVALSGGVFQNRRLFRQVIQQLETEGFKVLTHKEIPSNDGCISLGQAVIAANQGGL